MRKLLKVIKIDDYKYTFLDENNNTTILKIEFYDFNLEINDILKIDDKLLHDIKYSISAFGNLDDKTGRDVSNLNSNDLLLEVIEIERNNNKIYLKRLYG